MPFFTLFKSEACVYLHWLWQVDQLIGKNHLFKRSVVLIKAWCFYESRILGAHSGLISTYALETLIVHIINLYHSTLCSPLAVSPCYPILFKLQLFGYMLTNWYCTNGSFLNFAAVQQVLYKFLAYYSKFDWENYCVAINGVMLISDLPEVVGKTFLNGCMHQLLYYLNTKIVFNI